MTEGKQYFSRELTINLTIVKLLIPVAIAVSAYLLCANVVSVPVRMLTTFLAIFLVPGIVLRLVFTKKEGTLGLCRLMIEGLFISIILGIATMTLFSLCTSLVTYFPLTLFILTAVFLAIYWCQRKAITVVMSSGEISAVLIGILGIAILSMLLAPIPRMPTADETGYIMNVRHWLNSGVTYGFGVDFLKSNLTALLTGRIAWTMILSLFLVGTGFAIEQVYLIGVVFLVGITWVSVEIVQSCLSRKENLKMLLAAVIVITSPLLLTFVDFVLLDLALAFFLTFSLLLFLEAFPKSEEKRSIDFRLILASFALQFFSFQLKLNVMLLLILYVFLFLFALKNKLLWRYKFHLALLVIPVLIYELFIDLPYIFTLLAQNYEGSLPFYKFEAISPLEYFVKIFVPFPWSPQTLFTYTIPDHLRYLYRIISPEHFSLIVVSIVLLLPFIIFSKKFTRRTRWLAAMMCFAFPLLYVYTLPAGRFPDIPRNSLFIVPALTLFFLVFGEKAFNGGTARKFIAWISSMVLLVGLNYLLLINDGGALVAYGGDLRNDSIVLMTLQIIAFSLFFVFAPFNGENKIVRRKGSEETRKASILRKLHFPRIYSLMKNMRISILLILLTIVVLLSNVHFSQVVYSDSYHFRDPGLAELVGRLENLGNPTFPLVLTNSYLFERTYLDDKYLSNGFVAPPPMSNDELKDFLRLGLNQSLIVVHRNSTVAWYEYANQYIKDGVPGMEVEEKPNAIIHTKLEPYEGNITAVQLFAETRDELLSNLTVSNTIELKEIGGNKILYFDGNSTFVEIPQKIGDNLEQFSVELWFNSRIPLEEQNKWAGIISRRGSNTPWDIVCLAGKNKLRAEIKTVAGEFFVDSKKSDWKPNSWFHVAMVYDGQTLSIYINGILDNLIPATGLMASSDSLTYIGKMETNLFSGLISQVRFYGRALTTEEIENDVMSAFDLKFKTSSIYESPDVSIYQVSGPNILHHGNDSFNVKSLAFVPENSTAVSLNMSYTSKLLSPINASLLVGNQRFLKIFNVTLVPGDSSASFLYTQITPTFLVEAGSASDVLLLDKEGTILYRGTVGADRIDNPWLQGIISMVGLFIYLLVTFKRNDS